MLPEIQILLGVIWEGCSEFHLDQGTNCLLWILRFGIRLGLRVGYNSVLSEVNFIIFSSPLITHTHSYICTYIYIYIYFKTGGDTIPTVREKSVKSLGRLYSIPLTDSHRSLEVQKVALKGLKSTDKTCLPGKMKAWFYQHGLLPHL